MKLGAEIRSRRLSLKLSIRQVAAKAGISNGYLSKLERGQVHPSARVLLRIAEILGKTDKEVLTLAGYYSDELTGLDPLVAAVLGREPVEVQRAALVVLKLLKSITS